MIMKNASKIKKSKKGVPQKSHRLTRAISYDFGTVTRFCRLFEIKRTTAYAHIHGFAFNKAVHKALGRSGITDCWSDDGAIYLLIRC